MALRIINYPHPVLRRPSKTLRKVDAELRGLVREMFDLMYEHDGVGLAANQVNLPYRLFIMNEKADPNRPELEHVFINPVLSLPKGSIEDEEGCLSLPNVRAPVRRPDKITVNAYNLAGEEISYQASGLLSRIIQHETDHLDGVLFIDRLSPTARMTVKDALDDFEAEFVSRRASGEIPGDEQLSARWAELEGLRT